jgi:hypothetical protein
MKFYKAVVALFASFAQIFALFAVNKILIPITLLLINYNVFCQNNKQSETITEIAEQLAADESNPETSELFVEQLNELYENPVIINSGDESELSRLFFLSDFQIRSIRDHIEKSGSIVSVYEIASIPGFDRGITEMMIPFVSLKNVENDNPEKIKLRNNFLSNFINKPGESDTSSPGSQWRVLSKYKITAGPFTSGLTSEKDAGEKFLSGSPPLPDFLSSYFSYSGKGIIRKIIVGDFSASFGQGTNINTRMRPGSSTTASVYISGHDEIKPHTSSDENNFFRGAAMTISAGKMDLSLFFSHNRKDASISWSADSSEKWVTNLYNTGLHNSESLLSKKDAVAETSFGINLNCNIPLFRFGLTWTESRFSLPLVLTGSDPEDVFGFVGKMNGVCSVYYNSLIKRILLFGEFSTDYTFDLAMVQGVSLRPSDRLSINFLYRNYSPGFTSFHGKGPGNGSSTANESGILGNFTFEAAKHLFISAGCDIAWFPWLKYRTSFPSRAIKQEIKIRYMPDENFTAEASYNYRFSMSDANDEQGIAGVSELTARTLKGIIKYSPIARITLTTRIDLKIVDESGSRGMLLLQDISYRLRQVPVTILIRHCIFSTDDWDSRIYAYENDLLYNFSIPALSGRGSRSYLMAEWEIRDKAEFRIKYGLTTQIEDDSNPAEKDELKIQFRLWF